MSKWLSYFLATALTIGFLVLISWAQTANGHEGGHAKGIMHMTGHKTPGVDKAEGCPGQNKVLLYHDIDNDGIYDVCSTLWQEHFELHIIISEPVDNKCECEGYLWLDGDTQDAIE